MARAALGISRDELATRASLGGSTVVRFEAGKAVVDESIAAMRTALERDGVEFIPAGATIRQGAGAAGPGVRLR